MVRAGRDHRRPHLLRHHHAHGHPARLVRDLRRLGRGLGIWGAIAAAAPVGAWRVRKHGASVAAFMDAVAPALLVAQGIGRIGNYFNKELFGGPTHLPWGLGIPLAYRPPGYTAYATFQPSFLYELIWDCVLAAFLVWLGHHRKIAPPGLFALYVTGYSAYASWRSRSGSTPPSTSSACG